MFSVNQLTVQFSGNTLFDKVSFIVNDRDRIGLVGRNGAGKTTLMRIMAGLMEPESGHIAFPSGTTVGYLAQEPLLTSRLTVLDEALTAFDEIKNLRARLTGLGTEMAERTDYDSDGYARLIAEMEQIGHRLEIMGEDNMLAETEKVLLGLGFESSDFTRSLREFSGGWQMRVEIARLLLCKPDLLLLDEPTNHLDIESIQWLETFLSSYQGAVLLVSHDRAFLDNVTSRTIEISLGKIYDYKAGYSEYVELRSERREMQIATKSNQDREIAHIEKFVERFRYKATKARQVQSRIKLLDKIQRVEVDETDTSSIRFLFPQAPPSGKVVFEAEDISKSYPGKQVLNNISFAVLKEEKIAFVGRNGEGKTTLARILAGDLDHHGKLTRGYNVSLGYYAQNQTELLNPELTVFQTIDNVAVGDMRPRVRSILGSFLFGGDTIDKKVKVLSGGEKSRLALARMLLTPVNLLILDEPTNHLDMVSKDILKNALIRYNGTLIIVSHDRDFLQGLTSKVFEFRNQVIRQYIGDVYGFLESRKIDSLRSLEQAAADQKNNRSKSESDQKADYERRREYEREIRRIESRIGRAEATIAATEGQIAATDHILTHPDEHPGVVDDPEFFERYKELKSRLQSEMEEWEKLHTNLDELKRKFQA